MLDEKSCPECGSVLSKDSPFGLCLECLLVPAPQGAEPDPEFKASENVGGYKLLQKLGEGGMGEVWMAEQTEPIRRTVALKIVRRGQDPREILARFRAERQALALMDHPNIARVLDAGSTPDGRPYFAMELIKGVAITEFCDGRRLSLRERLELFIPVCQAIQHAHQKGMVHRDIKPSNVLVALYDGQPVPKVIDFGIAKAVGQPLTRKTLFTSFGAIVGTPEYMSPEQAELNPLDIDTRSDVYGLGVLLYELLTGTTPLSRDTLHSAAFDEILRRIRTEDAPRPSTRVGQHPPDASILAARRGLDPGQLTRRLRGDLDWIVMKSLRKERADRYQTALGLAEDIQRHLVDEPVTARAPGRLYLLRKTFARHRPVFLSLAMVVVVSLSGFGVSAWLLVREREAFRQARAAESARAAEARKVAMLQARVTLLEGDAGTANGATGQTPFESSSRFTSYRSLVQNVYDEAWGIQLGQGPVVEGRAILKVTVDSSGRIVAADLTPSGNEDFDRSVRRAMAAVKNLPSFPEGRGEPRSFQIEFALAAKAIQQP